MKSKKDWHYSFLMASGIRKDGSDLKKLVCEIRVTHHSLNKTIQLGFLSYDNGIQDIRAHLDSCDDIPIDVILKALEKGRKLLIEKYG